jgi:hypothetical protein
MKSVLHLASPIATLIGLLISTWGTYRLMLYYHPSSGKEFWKSFRTVCWLALRSRRKLETLIRVQARAAMRKEENRVDSLKGVYLLFVGFALQVFGAMCWCIDSMMDLSIKPGG